MLMMVMFITLGGTTREVELDKGVLPRHQLTTRPNTVSCRGHLGNHVNMGQQ